MAGIELDRATAGAPVDVKLGAGAVGADGAPASGGLLSSLEFGSAMIAVCGCVQEKVQLSWSECCQNGLGT